MSIFQKSIVKKHISSENPEVLKAKWNLFTSYFHNATIQENIHNSKEEQFQEGFLRELFASLVSIFLFSSVASNMYGFCIDKFST